MLINICLLLFLVMLGPVLDIMCLSYDGNITDACLIAAFAALQNSE